MQSSSETGEAKQWRRAMCERKSETTVALKPVERVCGTCEYFDNGLMSKDGHSDCHNPSVAAVSDLCLLDVSALGAGHMSKSETTIRVQPTTFEQWCGGHYESVTPSRDNR